MGSDVLCGLDGRNRASMEWILLSSLIMYLRQTVRPLAWSRIKFGGQWYGLRIEKPGIAARIGIDALRTVATAALARLLPVALDFFLAACLAGTPNSLAFIHGRLYRNNRAKQRNRDNGPMTDGGKELAKNVRGSPNGSPESVLLFMSP